MAIQEIRLISSIRTQDDGSLFVVRKDFSGGENTRMHPSKIGENQLTNTQNSDLGVTGQAQKRYGSQRIGDFGGTSGKVGNDSVLYLHNYSIQGGNDQLLMFEDTSLWKWTGSLIWSAIKINFSASTEVGICSIKESGLSPDDVVIVQNAIDNAFRIDNTGAEQDLGNTNTSPPLTQVMCWYGNRLWCLKNDLLYWSDAYASDYSVAFDRTTNSYRIPVGSEMGLASTRNIGIIALGEKGIWAVAPSVVPSATDKPEPIVTNMGCVGKKAWTLYGDDLYFFSQDGFRSLKRTEQDKLQIGANYPISYRLKSAFSEIHWTNADKISMIAWDNKIFIGVPTSSTTWKTWIYYPATDAFEIVDGWHPTCWATYKVDGDDRLYYGLQNSGEVFRAWFDHTDESTVDADGTNISMVFESREEDFGQPLIYKVGGELEIESEAAGSGEMLTISAAIDGGSYTVLGTVNSTSLTAPILPIDLPFYLADSYVIREKFHLESLGRFRTIQIKIENSGISEDPIYIYGYNITTFAEEYINE